MVAAVAFRPASGSGVVDGMVRLLGRRRAWRLGRKLYLAARGEGPNDIDQNGESALMDAALAAFPNAAPFRAWDVGANLGEWTDTLLAAAAKGDRDVRVELFEPTPTAFASLTVKYAVNPSVAVQQVALSSRAGTAEFEVVGSHAGTNSLNLTGSPTGKTISVALVTGAEVHEGSETHLIKIDTEGHDLEVLRGLEPLLSARSLGIVQFEYNWRWLVNGSSLRAAVLLAERHGYRVGRVAPEGLEIYDMWNGELDRFFETNYALVRPDVLPRLRHRVIGWCEGNLPVERSFMQEAAK
ncbi:MAG: FkbM family methyltransferase [Sphingomicrobium sp.]